LPPIVQVGLRGAGCSASAFDKFVLGGRISASRDYFRHGGVDAADLGLKKPAVRMTLDSRRWD